MNWRTDMDLPPALTREEGDRLAALLPDEDARRKLVAGHIRLCAHLARRMIDRHKLFYLPVEDLIAEGCLGLIRACEKWDGTKGANFTTYAYFWVQHKVSLEAKRYRGIISFPKDIRLENLCGLDKDEYFRLCNVSFLTAHDTAYTAMTSGTNVNPFTVVDARVDVEHMLQTLKPRDRDILIRRSHGETLDEIGKSYEITRERVRQLEYAALCKLKETHETDDLRIHERPNPAWFNNRCTIM